MPRKTDDPANLRLSVVIPVHNRRQYIGRAIDSVLSQTFTNFELIVVDDGSTDDTPDLLNSYGTRIRVIRQRNSGPEVARNTGVAAAYGEYIALLDSDDFYFPTTLETYDRVIQAFDSPPLIVGSDTYYQDGTPIPVQPEGPGTIETIQFADCLSKTVPLALMCSLYVIRRSTYKAVGGFRNSTAKTWHGDIVDFLLRLGTCGPLIIIRKPYTTAYRVHQENSVKSARPHASGLLEVARCERQGSYPGGPERRRDRYAFLGGISAQWAVAHCWRDGDRGMAFRLLFGTAPMVAVAVWRKFLRPFRARPVVTKLPEPHAVATIREAQPAAECPEVFKVTTRH